MRPDLFDPKKFLDEVRAFIREALTPDLRRAGRDTIGTHSEIAACRAWHRRLYERGWIAPAWPKEFGGTGWSVHQRLLFDRECAENDAPVLFASGIRNVGPLLIHEGTEDQKHRFLPAIRDGSAFWCQGFSEPTAGSDLACLRTQAKKQGESYIVTGSKIWTTGAQHANWMFCLVRTAQSQRPQDGITFLLLDMHTPGLSVRPIKTLDGGQEFCEVFFDSVPVPAANRVGEENGGWSVAKRLMRYARSSNTTSGMLRRTMRRAVRLIELGQPPNPDWQFRLAHLECMLTTFEATEDKILQAAPLEGIDDRQASTLKILATELHQEICTLGLEAAGYSAAPLPEQTKPLEIALEDGNFAIQKYLATRAASIYSGTNETHRNLMAKTL